MAPGVNQQLETQGSSHRYLFLQGHPSKFSYDLGQTLKQQGAKVNRINFCAGDWLYWRGEDVIHYRGKSEGWADFLEQIMRLLNVTHIIYFADRLPYHVVAQKVARKLGVQSVAYEFGYLRPDWIVAERGGQSIYSHFPDDMELVRKLALQLPEPDMTQRYGFSFSVEAFNEVLFNLVNYFFWFAYPNYHVNRMYNPLIEYLGYIPRLIRGRFRKDFATERVAELSSGSEPYFVVGLQMQGDYQVQKNSSYSYLGDFIQETITSFTNNASSESQLVFKKHPLDNGLENWSKVINSIAKNAGVEDRIVFLDGGNLHQLLKNSQGNVVINSTVGLHALQLGIPVKVMGVSVFDLDGVTHQGNLDSFWISPEKPKAENVDAMVRLLAASVHVRGDFFSKTGRAAAARDLADRLQRNQINSCGAFVDPPPRIAKALKAGILFDY
jgi:capsular polysaccharide export protein